VEPYQEAGNIYLLDPSIAPWVEDYIAEFQNFPNGAHDDQVDATSQAIVWLLKRRHQETFAGATLVTRSWNRYLVEPGYRDPRYGDEPLQ
jgi:hypothetical protein